MAESVARVRIQAVVEGLEGFDRVTSSLKKLADSTRPAEQQIDKARQAVLAFGQTGARTEQIIGDQINALKALSKEVALGGNTYQELANDVRTLEAELRGTTPALEQQRRAVLQNVAANQENASALQLNIRQLERLRQQTRPGSSPYTQLGQDIDQARRRVTGITGDLQLFNLTLNQPPGASSQVLTRQIGILQRNMQGLRVSSDQYAQSLERVNLLQTVQGQRGARQQAIASAAMYASEQYQGFVRGPLERFELPDTLAGLRARLGELTGELNNAIRSTQGYVDVALEMAAVQREASAAAQGLGQRLAEQLNSGELARSQKSLTEVIGQLRTEMRELDTRTADGNRGYADRARLVTQLEQELRQLEGAYRSVGEASRSADRQPGPYDTFDPSQGPVRDPATGRRRPGVLSVGEQQEVDAAIDALNVYDTAMADLEETLQSHRQSRLEIGEKFNRLELDQLDRANDQALKANQDRFEQELKQFDSALNQRNQLLQRQGELKQQLGLGGRELSELYQNIVNVGSSRELASAQRMGRSPVQTFNDIVNTYNKSLNAGQNITDALASQIDSGVSQVAKSSDNLAKRLIEAVKKRLGIRSPSTVFIEVGQRIVEGLVKGIASGKSAVAQSLADLFATVQKAPLAGQVGETSDLARKIAAFVARNSAQPSRFRPYANLAGDDILGSPAVSLATYRKSYERGGIVPPIYTDPSIRRNLRGTSGIPGAGLEQSILDTAMKAVSKTGSLFGPIKGPINLTVKPNELASTFGTGTTSGVGGRVLPVFRGSVPSGGSSTGSFAFGSSVPALGSQFPMDPALTRSLSLGRGGASQAVKESINGYRKAVDNFWDGEGKEFEAITKVVTARAQVGAAQAARRLTESRNAAEGARRQTENSFLEFSRRASQVTDAASRTGFADKFKQSVRSLLTKVQSAVVEEVDDLAYGLKQDVAGLKRRAGRVFDFFGGATQATGGANRPGVTFSAERALPDFGSFRNASTRQLQDVRSALEAFRMDLSPLDDDFKRLEKAAVGSLRNIDKELERRDPQGMRGKVGYIGQGIGAIASAGFFGGPEGALGGALGGGIGGKLGGAAGFATGAFIGSSIGAYASQIRQQINSLTDYASQIKRLQIALKGVAGSTAQYEQALRAAGDVTRNFNVPQLDAIQGMTRLTAAVRGAGGNVADAEVVFKNVTAAIKATGGGAEEVQGSLLAMSQIFSKGKVSAEELQGQLGERLPGAVTMFAEATGRTLPQLQKDLEQGVVGLGDVMKFVIALGDKYTGTAKTISNSTADAGARLQRDLQDLRKTIGDVLMPLGAEIQDALGKSLKELTPTLVSTAKMLANAIKLIVDNAGKVANLVLFATKMGAVGLAIKGFVATQPAILAVFAAIQLGGLKAAMAAALATPKILALGTAIKGLLKLGIVTIAIDVVVSGLSKYQELKDEIDLLRKYNPAEVFEGATRETVQGAIDVAKKDLKKAQEELAKLQGDWLKYQLPGGAVFGYGIGDYMMDEKSLQAKIARAKKTLEGLDPAKFPLESEQLKNQLSQWETLNKDSANKQAEDLLKSRKNALKQIADLERGAVDQMEDLRKQTIEDIAKFERDLGDERVKVEREIAEIRRKTAYENTQASLERQIQDLASKGLGTAAVQAEKDLNEIFFDYNEKKISREQQAQDAALERARRFEDLRLAITKAIAQIQEGVAKQAGEIQRAYAENVAEILQIGGDNAGNAIVEGAKQAAQILSGAGGGAPVPGSVPANAGSIATTLQQALGLSKEQVSGIIGNLIRESGLNPRVNEGGLVGPALGVGGYGLAQWTGGRQQALRAFAGYDDAKMGDVATQLAFLVKELRTTESRALLELRKATTPEQAAVIFEKFYERAGIKALDERKANARSVFDRLGPGNAILPQGITKADVGALPAPRLPGAFDYSSLLEPVRKMGEALDALFAERDSAMSVDQWEEQVRRLGEGYDKAVAPLQAITGESAKNLATQQQINTLIAQGYTPELAEAKAGWQQLVQVEKDYLTSVNARLQAEIDKRAEQLQKPGLSKEVSDQLQLEQLGYQAIIEANQVRLGQQDGLLFKLEQEYQLVEAIRRERELMQDTNIGAGLREGAQGYIESIGTMREATAQLAQNGIKGIEDAIFSLVTTGKANFREFAADILKQTARMIIQQLVLRAIMQAIGGIGGGGGGLSNLSAPATINNPLGVLGSANGNAFAQNGIVPYAMGGIVNKPTLFKFANGGAMRTGVMGEAGPEAIIPLKRGRDGKLGVAGGGGGSAPVTVNVSVDASGNSQVSGNAGQGEQLGRVVAQAVQAELVRQKRPGGLLAA